MGACNFIEFEVGKSAEEAFSKLCDKMTFCYGHDPYNGTISTTSLSRRPAKAIQKTWGPMAEKKAVRIAEDDGWGKKWEEEE